MANSLEREAMALAMGIAARVRTTASPNPWVGAALIADGAVIALGATEAPGGRHAEIVALESAGSRAQDSTLVVTLEPCAHQGRTGPCVEAIKAAGVA
ncbi:MAG: riboflavin biosynthesis protein RibD, partial [Actinomycetota bacterium]